MEGKEMTTTFEAKIVTKPAFHAVGIRWEGTFAEAGAGGIRKVMKEMQDRLHEIEHVINPKFLLGLSYHMRPDGFTHYSVVEVGEVDKIPEGMVAISVPSLTYATCQHIRGQEIERSYKNIYEWIAGMGYSLYEGDLAHYEEYPIEQDPYSTEPEFKILIPIVETSHK
jgi:predicted transcriptional regulator YdeE